MYTRTLCILYTVQRTEWSLSRAAFSQKAAFHISYADSDNRTSCRLELIIRMKRESVVQNLPMIISSTGQNLLFVKIVHFFPVEFDTKYGFTE